MMNARILVIQILMCQLSLAGYSMAQTASPSVSSLPAPTPGSVRVATFNVALNRKQNGQLVTDLERGDPQARSVATIVQLVRPDILLANEVDFSEGKAAPLLLEKYFRRPNDGRPSTSSCDFPFFFTAPVNTGVASGLDLNNNGRNTDYEDAWGFGAFPGQYGMVVYSKFPILQDSIRTFQNLKWSSMPDALRPKTSDASTDQPASYYSDEVWSQLRLSSKSHWDVPIDIHGKRLHLIASHPTPPVFDGPEDRNGRRNHDEIRLLKDYVEAGPKSEYIVDDRGIKGPLSASAAFVIAGDLNSDPNDGSGILSGIQSLLDSPRVSKSVVPASAGALESAKSQGKANATHKGNAAHDTGDFNDASVGNLRIDFVLPSSNIRVVQGGVFWLTEEQLKDCDAKLGDASDHHLVWIDIAL